MQFALGTERQGQAHIVCEERHAAPPLSFPFPCGGLTRRWYHGIMLSKTIFADEVVPNTGPWLTRNKFKQFPVKYLFGKVTASSHCPQASRLVENGVKI